MAVAAAQFAELAQLLAPNAFAAFEWMFAAYGTDTVGFVPLIELLAPAPAASSSASALSLPPPNAPLLQVCIVHAHRTRYAPHLTAQKTQDTHCLMQRHPLLAPASEAGEARSQLGEFARRSYAAMLATPLQVQDAQLDSLFIGDFCEAERPAVSP